MPYILENMQQEDIREVAQIERLCFSMPWPVSAYRRELKTPDTNRYLVARFVPPEIAATLNMSEPTLDTISSLSHPELYRSERRNGVPREHEQPARSLLSSLLPWLRHDDNGRSEPHSTSPFPIVGYAGLWLMVDEGHVTTIGVHPDYRGRGVGELLFLGLVDIARQMRAFRMTLEVRVSNTGAQALYRKYGFENAGVRKRYYSDNGEDAYIMWSEPISSQEFQNRTSRLREELTERMRRNYYQQPPPSRPVDASRLQ
jgi:[ribosomal protein S18]-alanine N-acetyltransferase